MTREEFREIREYFDGKFEAMEKRFEAVDRRFDAVDQRFDAVDRRFYALDERLENEFKAITEHFVEQRKYIEAGHERLETRLTREIASLRDDMKRAAAR